MKKWFDVKKPFIWILIAVLVLSGIGVWFLTRPQLVEISPELDACIRSAIRTEYVSAATEGKYAAVAYTALGAEQKKDAVVVYGVMMYREYTATTQDELKTWGTAQSSFVITAKPTDDGYALAECWWPAKGEDYKASIKKKVPHRYEEKLINFQRYYGPHDLACQEDAKANIPDTEKYTVLRSERNNVWMAYQKTGSHCYIASSGGYSATGTYSLTDDQMQLAFGDRQLVWDVDGGYFFYNAADSQRVPTSWESSGETVYLSDGTFFSDVTLGDIAPVGPTHTVSAFGWMNEQEMREMFGEYVVSDFPYDTADLRYLPVMTIKYRSDLEALLSAYADDATWSALKAEDFAQYDEAFFEDNYLIVTYYKSGCASDVPKVSSYVFAEDGAWLSVRLEVTQAQVGDTVTGQWLLFSGVRKSDHKRFTSGIEAYVDSVVEEDVPVDGALSFTGTVKQVEGRAVLLENTNASQFSSGVWVELGDAELDPKVGETYTVTYDGIVMPSMPPRITAITIEWKD